VVNAQGAQLTGYGVTPDGTIVPGQPTSLQIETSDIAPRATEASRVGFNLDSRAQSPSAMTPGVLAGTALAGSANIVAGTNDTLTLTLNGIAAVTVTIPPNTYTPLQLASTIQTLINDQLPANQAVTVTVNADAISVTSLGARGSDATIAASGTAMTDVFGAAAPTYTAGIDNFVATNPNSYTSSTSQTVYDSKGNPHTFTMYFVKTAQAGQWDLYTSLDGSGTTASTQINFNSSGMLLSSMPLSQSFALSNGAGSPLGFTVDLTGSTEFGNVFGVNQMIQDGYSSGRLSGLSIAADGVVQGRYSNGQARNLGQIVLVNFNNPNGLLSLGGNQWAETADSGQPLIGTPGTGSLGMVQAAAVEESNVDLTSELVNMITQQRAYQANAQSIRTQDQLLQTLVNLR
jgi:flagellar hook protein FlgE